MSNEIEKFDPSKLMDGVRDRIKATFVSLIPDAQWEQLCRAEADKFFTVKERSYRNISFSDFGLVCEAVLTEIAKEKLGELLKTYESTIWVNSEIKANEKLIQVLKDNASDILASMIGNRVSTIIHEMKNRGY